MTPMTPKGACRPALPAGTVAETLREHHLPTAARGRSTTARVPSAQLGVPAEMTHAAESALRRLAADPSLRDQPA